MKNFYQQLSPGKKRSLIFSMKTLIFEYLMGYQFDVSTFKNKEALVNDVYFYWLRHVAERRYLWCEDLNEDVFSPAFAREMKKKIRFLLPFILHSHQLKT